MMAYVPDETLAHRLDPRAKLAVQFAFALATFGRPTPARLALFTGVALAALAASGTPPLGTLWGYRAFLPFLVGAPAFAALTLGPPWVDPAQAVGPALSSYRVVLVLLVSAAYLRSTPVRESRAAIQRTVPGKAGTLLGVGVGAVLRFLPLMRADLRRSREAVAARVGTERGVVERARIVGVTGLRRLFLRADRLALALRARCFAWNPTLPELAMSGADWAVVAGSVVLAASALL